MRWARWIVWIFVFAVVGAFFHYTLPQRDIVYVVETTEIRQSFSWYNRLFYTSGDSGAAAPTDQRDVRFIRTIRPDGSPSVYRNEDTGLFGWPPYLKTDSEDLQTEASALVSNSEAPRWVVITHYGWRSNVLSAYPNAVSIREVDSPDVTLIPWFNIAILALLALGIFALWRAWERFQDRVIDPVVDRVIVSWRNLRDRFRR